MYLLTADEMRLMDQQTIETFGLPGRVLMENAGRGATRVLLEHFPDIYAKTIGVMAGRGNNGGDGFVIARYLAQAGVDVTVYLLSEKDRVRGDALSNLKLLTYLGVPVIELPDENTFSRYKSEMAGKHLWIDAILGTGLTEEVKGYFRSAIEFLNGIRRPIFSVDLPSGLHTETGLPCGICIRADVTATFALAKIGHLLMPGASYTGILRIIDIGIPPHIVEEIAPRQHLLRAGSIRAAMKPRIPEAHKGTTGHLLVVAGSTGKTGAAAMSAMSAMRVGAGLVTLGVPERINASVEPLVIEVMTVPLPDTGQGALSEKGVDEVLADLSGKQCLAIGPGIGTADGTRRFVQRIVQESPVPMVIDADGLNNLTDKPSILRKTKTDIVITPHPGEMARLIGSSPKAVQEDRIKCARSFAETHSVHVVLKGARTVIAHPDGHVYINPTGNPGMASGGMGDVLTGMIAGFITQGYSAGTAARIAVYLHGASGDILRKMRGPYGYLATDVMNHLPETIQAVSEGMFSDVTADYSPLL